MDTLTPCDLYKFLPCGFIYLQYRKQPIGLSPYLTLPCSTFSQKPHLNVADTHVVFVSLQS